MSSSLLSDNELRDLSLDAKLGMDLNFNICQQDTDENKRSTHGHGIKSANVINLGENVQAVGTQNGKNEFGSSEHVSLPTVFEGKITHERKVSQQEKLTNVVSLRRSRSNHDVRLTDPRSLSPCFPRFSSQENLGYNIPKSPIVGRTFQRKISSPLPTELKKSWHLRIRGRALSNSPSEALISPVISRRHLNPQHDLNSEHLQGGLSRVKSCPVIKSDSNERLNDLPLPLTIKSSSAVHSTSKPPDRDRLPQIHQADSPMLVRARKTSDERPRELFNVSPIMGQSGNFLSKPDKTSGIQCDSTDKVEYYLYSMSLDDDKDSLAGLSEN
ncbi:uncharacterized protein LOC111329186 [Stylophora pistillata]|uniref:Uncharacterized protein n=1 Tax=Stylophora pistillata TaxID=50429 RepID=A0A2B4SB57_STYPI|nr:uncharacterized protein LOC111329186 [Stylophora pistillata]XP_022789533.1 uncharacterized protein LOC111329186 [Stylophora pistillata]XP_022789534.1 uncharacterized protein LOC111329186 [Stylophora pistillata]PFX26263.1 hypothetical protein AWC38_SpisGene9084 [Stylophora pistillata]